MRIPGDDKAQTEAVNPEAVNAAVNTANLAAGAAGLDTGGDRPATMKDLDSAAADVSKAVNEAVAQSSLTPKSPAPRSEPKPSGKSIDDLHKLQEEEQQARKQREAQEQDEKRANHWIKQLEPLSDDPLWKLFVSLLKSASEAGETAGHATQYILCSALLKNDKIKQLVGPELEALKDSSANELRKDMPLLSNVKDHATQLIGQIAEYRQENQKKQVLAGKLAESPETNDRAKDRPEAAALTAAADAKANGAKSADAAKEPKPDADAAKEPKPDVAKEPEPDAAGGPRRP